jgi:sulfate adenylyltransferase
MPGTGFVLWFTGLSGSGKTTLSLLVASELAARGVHAERLDGDEIRQHFSRNLGFSREDRDENVRRLGFVAGIVERCGACAIVSAISPYRAGRDGVRRSVARFVEVFTECPLSVLTERDPKGLYKRAAAGELHHLTGVDDPYEIPEAPDVHLRTDEESAVASAKKILVFLEHAGLVTERP